MLQTVLLITAIGMGLVFVAILLLWGMMELLVRFTNGKAASPVAPSEVHIPEQIPAPLDADAASARQVDRKKIAAVAVVAALQLRRRQAAEEAVRIALASAHEFVSPQPVPPPQSSWQPVMRAAQMQNRLRLFSRSSRRSSS